MDDVQYYNGHCTHDDKASFQKTAKQQNHTSASLRSHSSIDKRPRYHVHGGMFRMARVMGEIGKPVHRAVANALCRNSDYGPSLLPHPLFPLS